MCVLLRRFPHDGHLVIALLQPRLNSSFVHFTGGGLFMFLLLMYWNLCSNLLSMVILKPLYRTLRAPWRRPEVGKRGLAGSSVPPILYSSHTQTLVKKQQPVFSLHFVLGFGLDSIKSPGDRKMSKKKKSYGSRKSPRFVIK